MKKKIMLMVLFSVSVLSYSSNIKLEQIGIINLQRIVEVCFEGKSSAVKQLMNEKEKFQKDLDVIKEKIMNLQSSLAEEGDESKKLVIERKINEIKEQYTNFYRKKMAELERKEKTIQAPLYEEIYDVVRRVAETEGFSVVLKSDSDALFYYNVESDITEKIIERFNRN